MSVYIALVFVVSLVACGHTSPSAEGGGHHQKDDRSDHHHDHPSHDPKAMNAKFMDPQAKAEKFNQTFENHDRDVFVFRKQIIEALDLRSGQTVADVGAGTGTFLSGLASRVGTNGKVFAVEISDRFIDYLKERAKKENLRSVSIVKGDFEKTNLAAASVNSILLVDVYHHFDKPESMLKDFRKILKDGGTLAVVDFNRVPGQSKDWIMKHTHLDKQGYIREISAQGFSFVKEAGIPMKENFMLIFKKR